MDLNKFTIEFFEGVYNTPSLINEDNPPIQFEEEDPTLIDRMEDEMDGGVIHPILTHDLENECWDMHHAGSSLEEIKEKLKEYGFVDEEIEEIFEIWSSGESAVVDYE